MVAMKRILQEQQSLVIRTDFSNEQLWEDLLNIMIGPTPDGFRAAFETVEEPEYENIAIADLMQLIDGYCSYFFVMDALTMTHPEHPILCVDMQHARGETFRLIPSEFVLIENNLQIANMDFYEFAENVDDDGIFRGF